MKCHKRHNESGLETGPMTYSDIGSERNSCGIIRKNMKFAKYLENNCTIEHMRVQERYRGRKKSREIGRSRGREQNWDKLSA